MANLILMTGINSWHTVCGRIKTKRVDISTSFMEFLNNLLSSCLTNAMSTTTQLATPHLLTYLTRETIQNGIKVKTTLSELSLVQKISSFLALIANIQQSNGLTMTSI